MELSQEIKKSIESEFSEWVNIQYAGNSKEDRKKLGQFFTPPELSIKMIEKFETLNGNILDPTAGCGGLLAAAVIAGANPRKCYGIELDQSIASLCRDRLAKLGIPRFNIKVGDALNSNSYDFDESFEKKPFIYFNVQDLGMCKVKIYLEVNKNGSMTNKEIIIDYSKDEETLKKQFEKIFTLLNVVNEKDCLLCSESDKFDGRLKFLNAFFKKYLQKKISFNKTSLIYF